MALTYLTLPAMSAEPERVFSVAKITLSDRRCRMGDVLEAVECLKSWQKDGMIAATQEDIKPLSRCWPPFVRRIWCNVAIAHTKELMSGSKFKSPVPHFASFHVGVWFRGIQLPLVSHQTYSVSHVTLASFLVICHTP